MKQITRGLNFLVAVILTLSLTNHYALAQSSGPGSTMYLPLITLKTLPAVQVSAGYEHTCAINSVGGVMCWGSNDYGELGDGTSTIRYTPVPVIGLSSGVAAVSNNWKNTCALTTAGGVKCWGSNQYGQLGNGTTTGEYVANPFPVDVLGLASGVTAIATGWSHTCALTTAGGVKCWGANSEGQLGTGDITFKSTPVNVFGLSSGVKAIVTGEYHTCALTTLGGVKCWGMNEKGQLGDGSNIDRLVPVNVTGLSSGIIAISGGGAHSCALTNGGGVKCWGDNFSGELGDGTTTNRWAPVDVAGLSSGIVAVTGGEDHTCAVTTGGGVKCWGASNTGVTSLVLNLFPVDIPILSSGVTSITAGNRDTCALTNFGGIRCWGYNGIGQLGIGTTILRPIPVPVVSLSSGVKAISTGFSHNCVQTNSDGVKCWGANTYGELGDGTTVEHWVPVDVPSLTSGVASVVAGYWARTCVLTVSGGLKCWGDNSAGSLGDGTTTDSATPVNVMGLTSGVASVAVGDQHTCALTTSGGVKCWGLNNSGQLGNGTASQSSYSPTPGDVVGLTSGVTEIAAGYSHTCALTIGGAVKCWGMNYYGELGNGITSGFNPNPLPVDVVGLSSGVVGIAAFGENTCALMSGRGVKCWGQGPVGDNTTSDRYSPVDVVGLPSVVSSISPNGFCVLTNGGGVYCWGGVYSPSGDGTVINNLTPLVVPGLASGIQAMSGSGLNGCVVTIGGGAKCWGSNIFGQVGDGTSSVSLTPLAVVGYP